MKYEEPTDAEFRVIRKARSERGFRIYLVEGWWVAPIVAGIIALMSVLRSG